jgi:DNA-binding MarR family transcriptional regulator
MKNAINDIEVYKAYIRAKDAKGYSVVSLCKRLRITRSVLYEVVKRVEQGDEIQLNRCLTKAKYDCLWQYRYFRRFTVGGKVGLKRLIKDMHRDGFGVRDIARRVSLDPSTVSYHIKG